MTPEKLEQGAIAAVALAEKCEASADEFDDEWRAHCYREADRHYERARWYRERKSLLETPVVYS